MDEGARESNEAVVLVHQGFRSAVVTIVALLALAALASAAVVWIVLSGEDGWGGAAGGLVYGILTPITVAAAGIFYFRRHRHDTTVLSSSGIVVRSVGESSTYRWEDMLEVGWIRAEYPTMLSVLYLRMQGATWANPGPNVPAVVRLPIYGHRNRFEAREAVRAACERHDIPFWEKAQKMMKLAPPGSRFRND